MTNAGKALKATSEADAPPRMAPEIDPAQVKVNTAGQMYRTMFVRLPKGFVADDLKEPTVWRPVQGRGSVSLQKFDQLFIVAYDESWTANVVVADANERRAVLAKPRITPWPPRFDRFLEDESYGIRWDGAYYAVYRKSDGHVVGREPTVALAERLLANQYPRAAA